MPTAKIKKIIFHKEFFNFINYYVFTIINAAIGLYTISYLTKHLLPEDYGMIGIFISIQSFALPMMSFSAIGLQGIEIVNLNKDDYLIFRNSYISFALLSGIICLLGGGIFSLFSAEFSFVIMMALLMGFILTFSSIHNTELIQYSQPTQFGLISSATALLAFVLTIVFISYLDLDWKYRIFALLISEFIILIFRFYIFSSIGSRFKFHINKEQFKEIFYYGAPLMLTVLIGWILNQSDRYFLLRNYSLKEVGLYAAAASISSLITMINANMVKVIYPLIYKRLSVREGKGFTLKLTALYSVFILTVALMFCVGIYFFGKYFLGSKYLSALPIIYIMCFSQAFFGIYMTIGIVIDYFKKTKIKTILVAISAISVIFFSFLLIRIIGLLGPAVALLISFFILSILSFIISRRLFIQNNIS
ncbi:MAG: oligosaccharide flippase family protein [Bacteroidota bacterium]